VIFVPAFLPGLTLRPCSHGVEAPGQGNHIRLAHLRNRSSTLTGRTIIPEANKPPDHVKPTDGAQHLSQMSGDTASFAGTSPSIPL